MQDLDSAVLLYSTTPVPNLNRSQLKRILVERYGGHRASWRVRLVPRGFLIYIPPGLYHDELNLDSHYWEQHNLITQPWQALNRSVSLPALHTVHITILDFPIHLWHPFYIRQAVTRLGFVRSIHRDCTSGEDSTAVRLSIDTPDTGLIPFQLVVGHQGQWTNCQVLMEGRLDSRLDSPPSPPPPPPPGSDDEEEENNQQGQSANADQFGHLYIPPWRRRNFNIQVPADDPSSKGAPAASSGASQYRSTDPPKKPGAGQFRSNQVGACSPGQLKASAAIRHYTTKATNIHSKQIPQINPHLSKGSTCPPPYKR